MSVFLEEVYGGIFAPPVFVGGVCVCFSFLFVCVCLNSLLISSVKRFLTHVSSHFQSAAKFPLVRKCN